jgi:hypothetical protein
MAIRVDRLSFNETDQVRHLFRAVDEWISPGVLLNIEVVTVHVTFIKTNGALEPKLLGRVGEPSDVHLVAERVVRPANVCRGRGYHKLCGDQTLVMALKRTQHHSVLAEGNWPPVVVGRDVPNGQRGHRNPPIDVQYRVK